MLVPFNAFQIVTGFAIAPFAVSWLFQADFPGAGVAAWVGVVAYLVYFAVMFFCVATSLDKN